MENIESTSDFVFPGGFGDVSRCEYGSSLSDTDLLRRSQGPPWVLVVRRGPRGFLGRSFDLLHGSKSSMGQSLPFFGIH